MDELIMEYSGIAPEEALAGSLVDCGDYTALEITGEVEIEFRRVSPPDDLMGDLELVRGVGGKRASKLRSEGYRTLEDLRSHPVYGVDAVRVHDLLLEGDLRGLRDHLNLPSSHPYILRCLNLMDERRLVFLDIETLGLSDEPVILLGMGWIDGGSMVVKQRLAVSPEDEPGVFELLDSVRDDDVLVTFNGASFDIPYIHRRLRIHGLNRNLDNINVDLYHVSRRRWGALLPDCRLCTVEKHVLGVDRDLDVPGAIVPEYYSAYLSTGNPGPLVPVVEHNREDIVSLAGILSALNLQLTSKDK
ncbi:ribonuclease H-like domain-containing protein [Methanothermobacter wolfeii]|uniref:ribonuclease H-like domain-containing protein n=1 Tax=Methanothermobacter wolfeii TaxID=145261 RepID=UPI0011AB5519|nr:ribonuclease H-like domain-containing protein [Methanothermobacter wolfeii]MDI6701550.1 ribonuclease H-like domain-containing protein [Methanothermobacter wolfeii]NLM01990.1 hypothetical protein [Methanothermobacter wolfeii]